MLYYSRIDARTLQLLKDIQLTKELGCFILATDTAGNETEISIYETINVR